MAATPEPPLEKKSDKTEVGAWLVWRGLGDLKQLFDQEGIDGEAFFLLNDQDFDRLKISTGPRKKIQAKTGGGQAGFDSEDLVKKLTMAQAPALRNLQQLLLQLNQATRSQGSLLRGHLFAMLDAEWRATVSESNRPEVSDAEFRESVVNYYGTQLCQVSGARLGPVTAAHIFPASGNNNLLVLLGLEPEDVNSPQNGLMLATGIEKALDRRQVSFFLDGEGVIRLRVLDARIAESDFWLYKGKEKAQPAKPGQQAKPESFGQKATKPEDSFAHLDGKALQFSHDTPPYRRLLAAHAELAKTKAKVHKWRSLDQAAVDVGINQLTAFRRLSPIPGESEDTELAELAKGLGITLGEEKAPDS